MMTMLPRRRSLARLVYLISPPFHGVQTYVYGCLRFLPATNLHILLDADRALDPQGIAADPRTVGTRNNREFQVEGRHFFRNMDSLGETPRAIDGRAPSAFEDFALRRKQSIVPQGHGAVDVALDIVTPKPDAISAVKAKLLDQKRLTGIVHDDNVEAQISPLITGSGVALKVESDVWISVSHLGPVFEPNLHAKDRGKRGGNGREHSLRIEGHLAAQPRDIPVSHFVSPFPLIDFVLGLLVNSWMKAPRRAVLPSRCHDDIASFSSVADKHAGAVSALLAEILDSWIGDLIGMAALFVGLIAFLWVGSYITWEVAQ